MLSFESCSPLLVDFIFFVLHIPFTNLKHYLDYYIEHVCKTLYCMPDNDILLST